MHVEESAFINDDPDWTELHLDSYVFWLQNSLIHRLTEDLENCSLSAAYRMVVYPDISFRDYVRRLRNHHIVLENHSIECLSIAPFLVAYQLIMRYFDMTNQNMLPSDLDAMHKLFAVAFWISLKIVYDGTVSCDAGVFLLGMHTYEINRLEAMFLKQIRFEIGITNKDFKEAAENYFSCKRITNFANRRHWLWSGAREVYAHKYGLTKHLLSEQEQQARTKV